MESDFPESPWFRVADPIKRRLYSELILVTYISLRCIELKNGEVLKFENAT